MELVDTKHFDIVVEDMGIIKLKMEAGPVKGLVEVPLLAMLEAYAKSTKTQLDDAGLEAVKKLLGLA